MGKYESLMDAYESWDLDSLCTEAYYISCALRDDVARKCRDVRDPLTAALMIGAYFMDADGQSDLFWIHGRFPYRHVADPRDQEGRRSGCGNEGFCTAPADRSCGQEP